MAKIHGLVFLAVGIFVAVASYKLSYDKLYVFFYAGLLFVIYGVAKVIIGFINKGERKVLVQDNKIPIPSAQAPRGQYKRCLTCGNTSRGHDNFCSRCGTRFQF